MRLGPFLAGLLICFAGNACGAADADKSAGREQAARTDQSERLARNRISIVVPEGWDGRVLFRERTGRHGISLQVANFTLPPNEGLEPPPPLPPGDEDPIKAMDARDVLVTITDGAGHGSGPPDPIGFEDLVPVAGPRVPHGHALSVGLFCFGSRCLRVEVDFGRTSPRPVDVEAVDAVLASLAVAA